MTAIDGKLVPVGLRRATIFALNASGSPAATQTTYYAGLQIVGAQAFDFNIPDARKITHVGDDRPVQVDYLPALDAVAGELRAARLDTAIYSLLSGTLETTVGESKFVGVGHSEQGSEPQVGLLMYQQALDSTGARVWRSILVPKATLYAHPSGMNESASVNRFIVSPAVVSKHLWETSFALLTEGFTEAQALVGYHQYKPKIIAFLATTGQTAFLLPAASPSVNVSKIAVWVDGAAVTENITKATNEVDFTTAPGNAKRVVIFYETETE